jgi:hypothetical protein
VAGPLDRNGPITVVDVAHIPAGAAVHLVVAADAIACVETGVRAAVPSDRVRSRSTERSVGVRAPADEVRAASPSQDISPWSTDEDIVARSSDEAVRSVPAVQLVIASTSRQPVVS